MLDYVTGDLHATESHKIKKPWILDVVDQMVLSASGFQTLPTNAGTETSPGLSHTCRGSHTHFLHYSCVFPHTQAHRGMFISAVTGWGENTPCWTLSSNLCVIMQMRFAWSMRHCGHLESTLAAITCSRSHASASALDGFDCWGMWLYESGCIEMPRTQLWNL